MMPSAESLYKVFVPGFSQPNQRAKPRCPVEVDWGNPLTKDMTICIPWVWDGGNGGGSSQGNTSGTGAEHWYNFNLVKPGDDISDNSGAGSRSTSNTRVWRQDPWGPYLYNTTVDGTQGLVNALRVDNGFNADPDASPSGGCTIMAIFDYDRGNDYGSLPDSGNERNIFGSWNAGTNMFSGGQGHYIGFPRWAGSENRAFCKAISVIDGGGTADPIFTCQDGLFSTATTSTFNVRAIQLRVGDYGSGYYDGGIYGTASSSGLRIFSAPFRDGGTPGEWWIGKIYAVFAWDRPLSPTELRQVTGNPYLELLRPTDGYMDMIFGAAAAKAVTNLDVFDNGFYPGQGPVNFI